jgi:hypothetical protein
MDTSNRRETIPNSLRTAVYERDKHRCRYCGRTDRKLCLDHVYPVSRGGETSFENLVTACVPCNAGKCNKVGIWPRPVDYVEMRDRVIGLQKETDEVLFDLDVFVLTQIFKTRDAEGRVNLWDIGRIVLRYELDVLEVCAFLDRRTNINPSFRLRIERMGIDQFFDKARAWDKQCNVPLLSNRANGNDR